MSSQHCHPNVGSTDRLIVQQHIGGPALTRVIQRIHQLPDLPPALCNDHLCEMWMWMRALLCDDRLQSECIDASFISDSASTPEDTCNTPPEMESGAYAFTYIDQGR